MEPLSQLLIVLASIAVVGVGGVGSWMLNYSRKRNQLRDIDQQVLGMESGADNVKLLEQDSWLEHAIVQYYLGYQEDWRTQKVLQETHAHYKSFIFEYVPVPAILGGRLKGVVVDFSNKSFPNFAVSNDKRTIQRYRSTHVYQKLNIPVHVKDFPDDLVVLGALKDQPEVTKFILENQEIYELFEHPLWHSLYVRGNFVAVYYTIHGLDEDDLQEKQFYSIDERIARLFPENAVSVVDPIIEINLLKDEENGS